MEKFRNFEVEKQRNILGQLMFRRVSAQNISDEKNISKITGMLIDQDILELDEILDMLENKESLVERINEALEIIEDSED